MKGKVKKDIAITLWTALGITIILAFFIFSMVVGGSAGNGYQESGKYFVGEHGHYLEVSKIIWMISYALEILFWIFIPLTPIGVFLISKIQKVKERKREQIMKFAVAHYKRSDADWLINGGKLIVTDREYILKCFLKTVARFEVDKTTICKIPDNISYKGILLSDGEKSYELYFFTNTENNLCSMLKIH